jgi:hypothetical protein
MKHRGKDVHEKKRKSLQDKKKTLMNNHIL